MIGNVLLCIAGSCNVYSDNVGLPLGQRQPVIRVCVIGFIRITMTCPSTDEKRRDGISCGVRWFN